MLVIKNKYLVVEVALLGAEVRKISSIDGKVDYLWSGDPKVWEGVSPVLFPIVGKAKDDTVLYSGSGYHVPKHGYARYSKFHIAEHTQSKLTLQIDELDIPDNIAYPFKLKFSVTYNLLDKQLITTYRVENKESTSAYFSVGAHPAFKYPFDDKHVTTDYYLEFNQVEVVHQHHFIDGGLWLKDTVKRHLENGQIKLEPHLFDNDALFFSGFKSNIVSLKENGSDRGISVSLDGFPLVGFWAKPGALYVCIEPWCGQGDIVGLDSELDTKPGIMALSPHGIWSKSYIIAFNY